LADFPGRTEADLYLWLMDYRASLADQTGMDIPLAPVAEDLVQRYSLKPQHRLERAGKRLLESVLPEALISGPPPGIWQQRTRSRLEKTLFADILLAVDGTARGWRTLSWLLNFARTENSEVHGLHVTRRNTAKPEAPGDTVAAQFREMLDQADVTGDLATVDGKIADVILDRARWMDLVVLSLSHPYESDARSRAGSGLRTIIRRSPTPVLVIPDIAYRLERLLLAFDGSPKAREALFVATYLTGTCQTCLDILRVAPATTEPDKATQYAREYIAKYNVEAKFLRERGPVGETILHVAEDRETDLIIMGGYGFGPVAELALGSALDAVLQLRRLPVLVCQ
ncbi:MAG: universal stress protein, partial [Anaerolineae bacterium]|nr:universal stress protein [Anaerolineae bacterium]